MHLQKDKNQSSYKESNHHAFMHAFKNLDLHAIKNSKSHALKNSNFQAFIHAVRNSMFHSIKIPCKIQSVVHSFYACIQAFLSKLKSNHTQVQITFIERELKVVSLFEEMTQGRIFGF